jgi:hypothetical protein
MDLVAGRAPRLAIAKVAGQDVQTWATSARVLPDTGSTLTGSLIPSG